MNNKYINIYNNFVSLTRNKKLYEEFTKQDDFSDRLVLFLFHFAFFLQFFLNKSNPIILQEIFDYIFHQLELSIREIGYGDASINKKMKIYINTFYSILDKIDKWNQLKKDDKSKILSSFRKFKGDLFNLSVYFDNYCNYLSNNTLNSHIKGVIKPEF